MCSVCTTTKQSTEAIPGNLLPNPTRHHTAQLTFHDEHAEWVETIRSSITDETAALRQLAVSMFEQPEVAYEEVYAAALLSDYMETKGFKVERGIHGLKTAWSAEIQIGVGGETVGFNSEMDALPGLGHACGHQLIAIGGCAAAVGVAASLKMHSIPGRVVLLGTPAEESGGGKIQLLNSGAYDSMAACLMLHAMDRGSDVVMGSTSAKQSLIAEYHGISAHAGASPHLGVNALDAAVLAYININTLRPLLIPEVRMFGIIGGENTWAENIIPAYAKVTYGIRAPTTALLMPIVERIKKCMNAAAISSGCEVKITLTSRYDDLQYSRPMGEYFAEVGHDVHGYDVRQQDVTASTDFGNVCYRMPALHPFVQNPTAKVGDSPHSTTYANGTNTVEAQDAALKAAFCNAVVGLRILADPVFRQVTTESWRQQMASVDPKL